MKSGISKSVFSMQCLKNNWKILLVLIPILFVIQRCFFPIIDHPELHGNTLPAQEDFTANVLKEFPIGSSESDLIIELKNEKFKIWSPEGFVKDTTYSGGASYITYSLPYPCSYEWRILWSSQKGKITKVDTLYGITCP